jgi:co-chaperonin GroES (HSP10)
VRDDILTPTDLIARRAAAMEAARRWRTKLLETLEHFPFTPFGDRVVVLRREAEHITKSGILLPQTANAPLSGWIVAVPRAGDPTTTAAVGLVEVGAEVVFPDHAAQPVSLLVSVEGDEREQMFLILAIQDLHGVVVGGRVTTFNDVVPGLEPGEPLEANEVRDGG